MEGGGKAFLSVTVIQPQTTLWSLNDKTHDIEFRIAFQILISTSGGIKGAFLLILRLTVFPSQQEKVLSVMRLQKQGKQ